MNKKVRPFAALAGLSIVSAATAQSGPAAETLRIGWAQTEITPQREACLGGMTAVRVSTGVMDPLTATALALEAPYQDGKPTPIILISCDLRSITEEVHQQVRGALKTTLPEVDPMRVILNATHTHNAPPLSTYGLPLTAMDEPEYRAFVAPRLAAVARAAWENRKPGGISYGLAHAVIGHNRIMAFESGKSEMGGKIGRPDFSHVEGYEDPAVQLLYTWDRQGELTGVVVNAAVTAQTTQALAVVSADYWHDTRVELRRRLGEGLFVLPQCSAAGDQMSRQFIYRPAEARMERLTGRTHRQQIATRLADAVTSILPVMRRNIEWAPVLAHRGEIVDLTRRIIGERDVIEAKAEAAKAKESYDKAMRELAGDPGLKNDPAWQRRVTAPWWIMRRGDAVEERFRVQREQPRFPAELHVIRLGDIAIAANGFELYLDFGIRIKARSRAVQTFVVQLAGGKGGGYIPTARSVAGGAYGAVPASTNVGPEGGKDLVDWTVRAIEAFWEEPR